MSRKKFHLRSDTYLAQPASFLKLTGTICLVQGIYLELQLLVSEFALASNPFIDFKPFVPFFFVLNLCAPFAVFLGLYFGGMYLGSSRTLFVNKLRSLSPGNIPIRRGSPTSPAPPPDSTSPSVAASLAAARAFATPSKKPISRRRIVLLLLLNILPTALAANFIPGLSAIYFFLALEFLCIPLVVFYRG